MPHFIDKNSVSIRCISLENPAVTQDYSLLPVKSSKVFIETSSLVCSRLEEVSTFVEVFSVISKLGVPGETRV